MAILTQAERKQLAQDMAPALRDLFRVLGQPDTDLGQAIEEILHPSNEYEIESPSKQSGGGDIRQFGIRIRIRIRLRGDGIPSLGIAKGSEIILEP